MADQKISEAYVDIVARLDKLQMSLNEAHGKVTSASARMEAEVSRSVTGTMGKLGGTISGMASKFTTFFGIAAPFAMGAAGAAALRLAGNVADSAEQINNLAASTGLTATQLQEFKGVAEEAGLSFETMVNASAMFQQKLGDIKAGTGDASAALATLGVDATGAGDALRPMNELFPEIISRLQGVTSEGQRNNLAFQLFGKGWKEIAPILSMTKPEFDAIIKRLHDSGYVMKGEAWDAAVKYGDAMDKLNSAVAGVRNTIAVALMPTLTAVANDTSLQDWAKDAGKSLAALTDTFRRVFYGMAAIDQYLGTPRRGAWVAIDFMRRAAGGDLDEIANKNPKEMILPNSKKAAKYWELAWGPAPGDKGGGAGKGGGTGKGKPGSGLDLTPYVPDLSGDAGSGSSGRSSASAKTSALQARFDQMMADRSRRREEDAQKAEEAAEREKGAYYDAYSVMLDMSGNKAAAQIAQAWGAAEQSIAALRKQGLAEEQIANQVYVARLRYLQAYQGAWKQYHDDQTAIAQKQEADDNALRDKLIKREEDRISFLRGISLTAIRLTQGETAAKVAELEEEGKRRRAEAEKALGDYAERQNALLVIDAETEAKKQRLIEESQGKQQETRRRVNVGFSDPWTTFRNSLAAGISASFGAVPEFKRQEQLSQEQVRILSELATLGRNQLSTLQAIASGPIPQ